MFRSQDVRQKKVRFLIGNCFCGARAGLALDVERGRGVSGTGGREGRKNVGGNP